MPFDSPSYRAVEPGDDALLASFSCSTGLKCEDEVEEFIRERAFRLASADTSYKLFLFLNSDELIAVAGHHPELLATRLGPDSPTELRLEAVMGSRLHVLALAREVQGAVSVGGARLADLVMESLIDEAMEGVDQTVLTAIVAKENLRSLRLCARHGLRSEVEHNAEYLRLSGQFTRL